MTSNAHSSRRAKCAPVAAAVSVATAVLLAACASPVASPVVPHYSCEHGITFTARFVDDTAVLDGARGREVLYRDAGGVSPSQSVYANTRMRAEFGQGATGREALLRYAEPPLLVRCARD